MRLTRVLAHGYKLVGCIVLHDSCLEIIASFALIPFDNSLDIVIMKEIKSLVRR